VKKDAELELAVELARLMRRFGPQVFEDLVHLLERPDFTTNLANALRGVARTQRKHKAPAQVRTSQSKAILPQAVSALRGTSPDKFEAIQSFFFDAINPRVITSARLSDLAAQLRITAGKSITDRHGIVAGIIDKMLHLPVEEIRNYAHQARRQQHRESLDRSLAGWTDVILRKRPDDNTR
jgi:hypothetical protein